MVVGGFLRVWIFGVGIEGGWLLGVGVVCVNAGSNESALCVGLLFLLHKYKVLASCLSHCCVMASLS